MARNIQVTPEQLESTAARIDGLAADYKSQYEQLYNETNNLAATWNGADNTAFVNQIEGFKDDLQAMYTRMTEYADFLRKSAKAYGDTQATVITESKKLKN